MEVSTLKLIVEKGPREGETLDCRSRSVIRIGRLIKGNTFSIKDAGISSKHLVIELKDGKWVVSDLDTSNGTLLNSVDLQPMRDYDLRDEDVIKIGELTSLKVRIEEPKTTNAFRNTRKIPAVDVEVEPEIVAENGENYLRRNPRRGAASGRTRASKNEASDCALLSISEAQKIGTKSNIEIENCGRAESMASVAEKPTQRGRRTRTRAPKDETVEVLEKRAETPRGESCIPAENVDPAEEKKMRRRGRRKAGVLKDEPVSVSEFPMITEISNVAGESCRGVDTVATDTEKETREGPSKNNAPPVPVSGIPTVPESLNGEIHNQDHVQKRIGALQDEALVSDPLPASNALDIPKLPSLQKETINESVDKTTLKESSPSTNVEKVANRIDLETMTLGEWFNYLEVYLPKQINETAEEIISSIRERSNQFNEFIQQQDLKGQFSMT